MLLIDIFTSKDHKLIRDYLGTGAAIVVLATIGTNMLSNYVGTSSSQDRLNISTVAANQTGVRSYTEVRSVMDSDYISTGSTNLTQSKSVLDDEIVTGSMLNRADSIRIDPCKVEK